MRNLACLLLLAMACAHPRAEAAVDAPAPSPSPRVVAVFDLADSTGALADGERRQLGDYLAVRLATLPGVRVVPRDQLREAMLEAKADSYRACFEQSCQIELGKALAADRSASPQLLRVGSRCAMTVALYDLRAEASERAASTQTECAADALFGAVDELVRQLGGASPAVALAPLGVRQTVDLATPEAPSPARRVEPERSGPPVELRLEGSGAATGQGGSPAGLQAYGEGAATRAGAPTSAPSSAVTGSPRPASASPGLGVAAPRPVSVSERGGRKVLVLPSSVLFERDADAPGPEARRALELAADGILRDPALRGLRLEVVGFAEPSERGRRELSERRARAARNVLVSRGLELGRLAVIGRGEGAPAGEPRKVELWIAED